VDGELLGALLVLALIDSTSFGTFLIPIWLMLAPGRLHPARIVLFLGVVAGFYFVLGIVLAAGALTFAEHASGGLESTIVRGAQLVVGIVCLVLGLTVEPLTARGKARRAAKREARQATAGPGRLARWRERATEPDAPVTGLMALALTAAAVEAASMLPYLGAIGLLAAAEVPMAHSAIVLAGYCLVMIAPALVLLGARVVLHDRVAPLLERLESWISRNSREMTAWILFIVGAYLTGDALVALGDR
jgi:cytochrome c biogenesis protein CcdA